MGLTILDNFWSATSLYTSISDQAKEEWSRLFVKKIVPGGAYYLTEGEVPRSFAFVERGLLNYFYINEKGDQVIKIFFSENTFVASTSAIISNSPSRFAIQAIEDTVLLTYDAAAFRRLWQKYPDVAHFYIVYLERHWVVEKEFQEISLKHDSALVRYTMFTRKYSHIQHRLKLFHIASYLGITPTQLSRIRRQVKKI